MPGRVLPLAALVLMLGVNIPARQRMASPVGAQQLTWDFLHDLRVARIDPPPGACLMIHNDPFHPSWDAYFIARLLYDDRSLRVTLRNAVDKTSRGDECTEGESLHYVWNPDRSLTDGRRRAPPESRYSR
jgi:hypothetical protein